MSPCSAAYVSSKNARYADDDKSAGYKDRPLSDYYRAFSANDPAGSCIDTDYAGAADTGGDNCRDYQTYTHWCGGYDDSDFTSNTMCCACGGGNILLAPTPQPTVSRRPTTPQPTDPITPQPTRGSDDDYEDGDGLWVVLLISVIAIACCSTVCGVGLCYASKICCFQEQRPVLPASAPTAEIQMAQPQQAVVVVAPSLQQGNLDKGQAQQDVIEGVIVAQPQQGMIVAQPQQGAIVAQPQVLGVPAQGQGRRGDGPSNL